MRRYSRITGTGSYLPPRRLTNADLAAELARDGIETSDEWIVERTGIRARHFAAPDVAASDLGLEAARNALSAAGLQAQDIDLIIVATSTPDMVFPSVACILQNRLGDICRDSAHSFDGLCLMIPEHSGLFCFYSMLQLSGELCDLRLEIQQLGILRRPCPTAGAFS